MTRPDGSNEPTRLPNLNSQPDRRFTPVDGRVDEEAIAEIADGVRHASTIEANRMAREIKAIREKGEESSEWM